VITGRSVRAGVRRGPCPIAGDYPDRYRVLSRIPGTCATTCAERTYRAQVLPLGGGLVLLTAGSGTALGLSQRCDYRALHRIIIALVADANDEAAAALGADRLVERGDRAVGPWGAGRQSPGLVSVMNAMSAAVKRRAVR